MSQLLVRYLADLTVDPRARPSRAGLLRLGAERAGAAVGASAVVVLGDGRVVAASGSRPGRASVSAVRAVAAGARSLVVEGEGEWPAVSVPVEDGSAGGATQLVVARPGPPLDEEETALLRAMAGILGLSLRSLDAVTAERALRRQSERQARGALRDALTGLPNRTLFLDRLETAAAKAVRRGTAIAVLFIDLDGFKVVNDMLGHAAGDQLLWAVAARIGEATRAADTVARLGGDEFAILVDDLESLESAVAVAGRVRHALDVPFRLAGRDVTVGASVGIAAGPRAGEPAHQLLADADLAMYRAKTEATGGHRVFSPEMRRELVERVELEAELRQAIGGGGLVPAYQAVVDMPTGRVVGLESLVRWRHPARGLLLPADFLPLAEESGMIGSLDNWALEEACRQLAQWRASYPAARDVNVAVNVSADQLGWEGLPLLVERQLSEWGVPPGRLVLEVSEWAMVAATARGHAGLRGLRAMGVRLALDDFGTGYSSLARLRDLPVDILKLDRSFVHGIDADGRLRALTANLCRLGGDLGVDVVAEGIETADEFRTLRGIGCRFGQGYHYGRPVGADAVERMLAGAGASGVFLDRT